MLQALIDKSQEHVTGTVRLKLYKGNVNCVGRWSDPLALQRKARYVRGRRRRLRPEGRGGFHQAECPASEADRQQERKVQTKSHR